ncbi:MAG: acyl-CoA thioesterase [Bdellovibrionota bacterium]
MQARPVSASEVIMTEMVLPQHTNSFGNVFGGQVMAWIDICAAIAAQRHARAPVVTASVDALQFVKPVLRGWTINLRASVNYTARTSMEIGVRVDAENPLTGERVHTASAYLTFVALGADGKPAPVPPVLAETADEKRRYKAAEIRRKNRLDLREQMKKG